MCFSIADNLPVATRLEFYPNREAVGEEEQKKDVAKDVQFEHGYRLGFVDSNKVSTRAAPAAPQHHTTLVHVPGPRGAGGAGPLHVDSSRYVVTPASDCRVLSVPPPPVLSAQPSVLHPVLPQRAAGGGEHPQLQGCAL